MEIISGKVKWIDMAGPTAEDLSWIEKEFRAGPNILEELSHASPHASIRHFGEYIFLVYNLPFYDLKEKVSRRTEVDLLISKRAVVTVHYDAIVALDEFKTKLEDAHFKSKVFENTMELTFYILHSLLAFERRQLHHIEKKVEHVSGELFNNREKYILTRISYLKRDISEYRIITRPQEILLVSLAEFAGEFWGVSARKLFNELTIEHMQVRHLIDDSREAVLDFEATNNQLMNLKTNSVMKRFTALSFLTFPFMLLAAIFSMEVPGMPLRDNPYGFWIVAGAIGVGMTIHLVYFWKKEWL